MKSKIFNITLVFGILAFVVAGVYSNVKEQRAVDRSKLPEKVEQSRGFQRWITNLKNKDIEIEADEFNLVEENEIYNTRWMTVTSIEEEGKKQEFEDTIKAHQNIKKVVFSPSEREFIDYRNEIRGTPTQPIKPNEVRFYGQKDDRIIDARILDCSVRANCYFDRAFFLDNDVFVVTEISRNISKKDTTTALCSSSEICTYTFKVHVIDLINNSRLIYESKSLDDILDTIIPEL